MNPGLYKNWYLVWLSALLLLLLGKVYEWAYPGFEHDYRHYLRNEVRNELQRFLREDQKHDDEIQKLLQKENSGSGNAQDLLRYLLESKTIQFILYENSKPLFWSAQERFSYSDWADNQQVNGLHILKHLDQQFAFNKISFQASGRSFVLVSYTPLTSVQSKWVKVQITPDKSTKSALAIQHPYHANEILAYLDCEGDFLAPIYGNVLILYYLLVLFLFYLPFHFISKIHYNQSNYPWGNLILVTGALVTISMSQWVVHQNDFYNSILTNKLIQTKFYNYTLFEFSVLALIIFHLCYFFYKYARFQSSLLSPLVSNVIVLANYLISIFSLVFYCFIFNAVFIHSDYYFDLSNVFSFQLEHFVLLFDLLIVLIAIFLLTNKLTNSTYSFQLQIRQRLFFYLIALTLATPLIYQSKLEIGLVPFLLATTIIVWMQDFFTENYQKNILWLISWIIVISILNSSLIFHFQNQKKRFIKDEIIRTFTKCEHENGTNCVGDLIQNCSTNNYDLYFYEDRLLKFSSTLFKPSYEQGIKSLGKDSIRHMRTDGKDLLYLKPSPNRLLIISNNIEATLKAVSLFSYLFTVLIVLSYLISLSHQRFRFLPDDLQISFPDKPSLKNRIQFYVILGIVISFLIIAITTVFFTRRSENEIYRDNLISKTRNLSEFLESSIRNVHTNEDARTIITTQIRQTSQMVDFYVRLYDPEGKEIKFTESQSFIPNSYHLLHPGFYFQFPNFAEDIIILEPNGFEKELNAFRNLFFNNQRIGILQVEAVASSEASYGTRLANLVNTLLNIYVFLFLIAASLATLLANSITSPLVTLTDKLQRIRLGKTNETLEWKGQDEIGELIQNYNQMVGQLDESARLLARNERDSAWREMAKQVAHEIKNPLTPMKLSIQYLQQTLRTGTEDIKEMAQNVCATLIEQIDSLSKIATEFSNFAKMPQAENEKLVLNEILSSVHDLFRKRSDIDIFLSVPIDELYVFADKVQVIRVLNNLINNAIQAIPEHRRGRIDISLDSNSKNAIICVQDNGSGIPEDLQSKVFLPNFTSKSSGTGLGLAMCQQIIESANGRIYFHTLPEKGTKFYVELPLMRVKNESSEAT